MALVYRNHLLPPTENFLLDQSKALTKYEALLVGARLIDGDHLSGRTKFVINAGTKIGFAKEIGFRVFGFAPGMYDALKEWSPALVHAHFGVDAISAIPLARRFDIPLLVSFHGYDATYHEDVAKRSYYAHRSYIRNRKQLIDEGSLFIAVSKFIREKLLAQGFPEHKVVVHYIGSDTEFFRPNPSVIRERIVLFVGRLVERKGCEYLIRAMHKIQQSCRDATLVVVGDGPLRADLEVLARGLSKASFVGRQNREQVRLWMNRAMVVGVPSITLATGDAEAFGLVCTEAQAMGTPVVAFDSGGLSEAVQDGITGFLAPEHDIEQLAQQILKLLSLGEGWTTFSERARVRTTQSFDVRQQTVLLESHYDEAVRAYRARSSVVRGATAYAGD